MLEIRFHGRGGQGTVVATILLAKAFFRAGYQVQSFPFFGVERRGAPVEAYVRLDKEKILLRTNVNYPDHVVVQDQTLLHSISVTRGLKPGGWVLINGSAVRRLPAGLCRCKPDRLKKPTGYEDPSYRQHSHDGGLCAYDGYASLGCHPRRH
jgi:Pyruvate/2-oxoacid:ferredoxin oxidoreductase gamma subunit